MRREWRRTTSTFAVTRLRLGAVEERRLERQLRRRQRLEPRGGVWPGPGRRQAARRDVRGGPLRVLAVPCGRCRRRPPRSGRTRQRHVHHVHGVVGVDRGAGHYEPVRVRTYCIRVCAYVWRGRALMCGFVAVAVTGRHVTVRPWHVSIMTPNPQSASDRLMSSRSTSSRRRVLRECVEICARRRRPGVSVVRRPKPAARAAGRQRHHHRSASTTSPAVPSSRRSARARRSRRRLDRCVSNARPITALTNPDDAGGMPESCALMMLSLSRT